MDFRDESVCKRIKEVMKEQSLKQKDLADKTGIVPSTISAILSGTRNPTPLIDAMSEVFGINKEWLMSGVGYKFAQSENLANNSQIDASVTDKAAIMKEINAMYERHQYLLKEAAEVMRTIVELNKKILLNEC